MQSQRLPHSVPRRETTACCKRLGRKMSSSSNYLTKGIENKRRNTSFLCLLVFGSAVALIVFAGLYLDQLPASLSLAVPRLRIVVILTLTVGCLIVLPSILSCFCSSGHIQKAPCMLSLGLVAMLVFLVVEIAAAVFLLKYRASLAADVSRALDAAVTEYGREPKQDALIDDVQSTYKCCGVRYGGEWLTSSPLKQYPVSCCHSHKDKDTTTDCQQPFPDSCLARVLTFPKYASMCAAVAAILLVTAQLLVILSVIMLVKKIRDNLRDDDLM